MSNWLLILTIISVILMFLTLIVAFLQYKKSKKSEKKIQIFTQYFPEINIIQPLPKKDEEVKENIENKNYSLIRDDLVKQEAQILSPVGDYRRILDKITPYLNKEDIDILIVCSAICKAQDEKQDNLATQILTSLVRNYSLRGKRIYNRFTSNVFKSNILPYLRELKYFLGDDTLKIAKMFQDYYDHCIQFLVDRVWVSDSDNLISVRARITDRFNNHPQLEMLWVYARKAIRVTIASMACKDFVNSNKDKFILKEEENRELRGKIAKTFIIKKIKKA